MSRLVLFAGIVLTVIGFIGFIVGIVIVPMQVVSTVSSASHPAASTLCHSDETLSTEEGPEEYDVSQQIYDHSVYFYCTNQQGVQRDVTDQVGQGVVNSIFGAFGSVLIPVLSSIACFVGVVMIIVGGLFVRRRAIQSALANAGNWGGGTPSYTPTILQQTPQSQPPIDSDLAGRLRQLEEARQSGLLTEDEYQSKRRQMLDSMK